MREKEKAYVVCRDRLFCTGSFFYYADQDEAVEDGTKRYAGKSILYGSDIQHHQCCD